MRTRRHRRRQNLSHRYNSSCHPWRRCTRASNPSRVDALSPRSSRLRTCEGLPPGLQPLLLPHPTFATTTCARRAPLLKIQWRGFGHPKHPNPLDDPSRSPRPQTRLTRPPRPQTTPPDVAVPCPTLTSAPANRPQGENVRRQNRYRSDALNSTGFPPSGAATTRQGPRPRRKMRCTRPTSRPASRPHARVTSSPTE